MTIRQMLQRLIDFTFDARGINAPVLVLCDGELRTVESVETRAISDGDRRPRKTFLLVIADGPADISEPSAITLRPRRS